MLSAETCKKIRKYAYSRLERFGGPQQVVVAGCNDPANAVYAGKMHSHQRIHVIAYKIKLH